jgi:hypothetical protein
MSGTPFQRCRDALKQLLDIQSPIQVVLFSSSARTVTLSSSAGVDAIVQSSGGTSFAHAITELVKVVERTAGFSDVVMFTDGQAQDAAQRSSVLNERCRFHVIGLGSFSDTRELLELRKFGYEPGTYGFASSPSELASKITEAASFAGTIAAAEYRGRRIFLRNWNAATMIVDSLESAEEKALEVVESTLDDELDVLRSELSSVAEHPEVSRLKALRGAFDAVVIAKTSADLSRTEYGQIIEFATILNDIAFVLHQAGGRGLSSQQLAVINDRASQVVTRRFAKLADKRGEAGAVRLERQDERLLSLAKEMSSMDLTKQPDLECVYTRMSVAELLSAGDCLCVGVRGAGKDAVIANPYMFKVAEVTPTLMSFSGFAESAYFTLKQNREKIREYAKTSLDAQTQADELARGIGGEEISGVVPLYLTPEHWRVGCVLLDRASAMLIAKDPTLGTWQHQIAALLLSYECAKGHSGERYGMITHELQAGLRALFAFKPSEFVTPEEFLSEPEKRLPTKMIDLRRQGPVMWDALGLPWGGADLCLALWEEEIRRDSKYLPSVTLESLVPFASFLDPIETADLDAVPSFAGLDGLSVSLPAGFDPKVKLVGAEMSEDLRWRALATALFVGRHGSTPTLQWPTVRRDFTGETGQGYARELVLAEIETRRQALVTEWQRNLAKREMMKKRRALETKPVEAQTVEDWSRIVYTGRGEVEVVLCEWCKTPEQLRLAVLGERLDSDKTGRARAPVKVCNRIMKRLYKTRPWVTRALLKELWPDKSDHIDRIPVSDLPL